MATRNTSLHPPAEALSAPCALLSSKSFTPLLRGDKSELNVGDWTASVHGMLSDYGAWDSAAGCPEYSVQGMWTFLKGMVDAVKCPYYGELLRTCGADEFWSLVQKRYRGEMTVVHQALALEAVSSFLFRSPEDFVVDIQRLEALAANLMVAFGGREIRPAELVLLSCLFRMAKDDQREIECTFTEAGGIQNCSFITVADVLAKQRLNDEAEGSQSRGGANRV